MGVEQGLQPIVGGVVDDDVGRAAEPTGDQLVVVLAADEVSRDRRIARRAERRAVAVGRGHRSGRGPHVLLVGAGQQQQLVLREPGAGSHAVHLRRGHRCVLANERVEASRGRQPAMEREPVTVPVFLVLRRKQRANALPGGSADRLAAFPGGAGCPDKPSVRHVVNSGADFRTPGGTLGGRG